MRWSQRSCAWPGRRVGRTNDALFVTSSTGTKSGAPAFRQGSQRRNLLPLRLQIADRRGLLGEPGTLFVEKLELASFCPIRASAGDRPPLFHSFFFTIKPGLPLVIPLTCH